MNKNKSIFSIVLSIFMIATIILLAVFAFDAIKTINSSKQLIANAYSDDPATLSSYTRFFDAHKTVYIISIVFSFISLFIALIGILVAVLRKLEKPSISVTIIGSLIPFVIGNIVLTLGQTIINEEHLYQSANVGDIFGIIFLFLSLLMFIISTATIGKEDKQRIGGICGIFGSLFMIGYSIIYVVYHADAETVALIAGIIMILTFVIAFARFVFETKNSVKPVFQTEETETSEPNKTSEPNETSSNKEVTMSNDKVYENLAKLKSLLDNGIITQEEYDEKRKKYVELL